MKCTHCKKNIDGDFKTVGISKVHPDCFEEFIKAKKDKKKPKKNKKKKNTPIWYREKSIELAKKIAKERDNYICQKCGRGRDEVAIQASHNIAVGSAIWLAAEPDNIIALCYQHHMNWWHRNDIDCWIWFEEEFPERYAFIKENRYKQQKVNWKETYDKLSNYKNI